MAERATQKERCAISGKGTLKEENGDCKAPVDNSFFVEFKVTLPYTKSSFGETEQTKYISAVATAANTSPSNVEIVSITEVRPRRRAGNIEVHTVRLREMGTE